MTLPELAIIGNLTRDPELRSTQTGKQVVNFTIAASDPKFNQNTGQWEDGSTLFLNASAWDQLAVNIANSVHKGMRVIVTGKLYQRSYQANDGTNRTVVEMRVTHLGVDLTKYQVNVQNTAQSAPSQQGGQQQYTQPQNSGQQAASRSQQQAEDPWSTPHGFANQPFSNEPEF